MYLKILVISITQDHDAPVIEFWIEVENQSAIDAYVLAPHKPHTIASRQISISFPN